MKLPTKLGEWVKVTVPILFLRVNDILPLCVEDVLTVAEGVAHIRELDIGILLDVVSSNHHSLLGATEWTLLEEECGDWWESLSD